MPIKPFAKLFGPEDDQVLIVAQDDEDTGVPSITFYFDDPITL